MAQTCIGYRSAKYSLDGEIPMHLYVLKCACHVYYSFGSRLRPKGLQTLLYLQEKWRTESSRVHPIEPNCPMNTHLKFKFKFKFKCFICHIHEHGQRDDETSPFQPQWTGIHVRVYRHQQTSCSCQCASFFCLRVSILNHDFSVVCIWITMHLLFVYLIGLIYPKV